MSFVVRNRMLLDVSKQFFMRTLPHRTITNFFKVNKYECTFETNNHFILYKPNLEIVRHKHNKKNQKQDLTDSEDENEASEWDNEIVDKQTKIMNVKVNTLRADVILKAGLGIARNKIETMFYESKIRVNGEKLLKKSAMLNVGDEIDIVKGASIANPDFLTVARVEILSASERSEGLNVKLRRNRSLTIEKYDS